MHSQIGSEWMWMNVGETTISQPFFKQFIKFFSGVGVWWSRCKSPLSRIIDEQVGFILRHHEACTIYLYEILFSFVLSSVRKSIIKNLLNISLSFHFNHRIFHDEWWIIWSESHLKVSKSSILQSSQQSCNLLLILIACQEESWRKATFIHSKHPP